MQITVQQTPAEQVLPLNVKAVRDGLIKLAEEKGFVPALPRYPKVPTESTIRGYEGRLFNWIKELKKFQS